jgi:hypothetical protein
LQEQEERLIALAHASPSMMQYLHKVASDVPQLNGWRSFKCYCSVEAEIKQKPMPGLALSVISAPGEVVSADIMGPFQIKSSGQSLFGLAFIDHYTKMPFFSRMTKMCIYLERFKQFPKR